MKKFISVFMIVSLIAGMFISCSNDVTPNQPAQAKDETAKIVIAGEKALEATGNDQNSYEVDDLYWFYVAVKTSGAFITGQQEQYYPVMPFEAPQEPGDPVVLQKGLVGADLGEFSKGDWMFMFKGYHDNPIVWSGDHYTMPDITTTTDDEDAIYFAQTRFTLTTDLSLTVTLQECDGMPEAGFYVEDIFVSALGLAHPESAVTYVIDGYTVLPSLNVVKSNAITVMAGDYEPEMYEGMIHFSSSETPLSVGRHNLMFVTTAYAAGGLLNQETIVGYESLTLVVKKGIVQSVSGTIATDDDMAGISIGAYNYHISQELTLDDIFINPEVTVDVAPEAGDGKSTTLLFYAESYDLPEKFDDIVELRSSIATADGAAAAGEQGSYVISDPDHVGVAALSFEFLDDEGDVIPMNTEDGISVTVGTYIQPGLGDNVIVTYEGTTEGISNVQYDTHTGYLQFKTTHFSTFLVELEGYVLGDNGEVYSLEDFRNEVNAGETFEGVEFKLMKDVDISASAWTPIGNGYRGSGSVIVGNKFSGTFDGQGHVISGLRDGEAYAPAYSTDGEYNYGLFGNVENAVIKNLRLTDVLIMAGNADYSADAVGALIGYSRGSLYVTNIYVDGLISGQSAAGVIGRAYGMDEDAQIIVSRCVNDAMIVATTPDPNNQSYTARAAGIIAFLSTANFGGADTTSAYVQNCVNNAMLSANGPKPIIAGILNYGYARKAAGDQTNVKDYYAFRGNLNNGVLYASEAEYWMAYIACSCSDDIKAGDEIDFVENQLGPDAEAWKAGEEAFDVLMISATQAGSAGAAAEFDGLSGVYPDVH